MYRLTDNNGVVATFEKYSKEEITSAECSEMLASRNLEIQKITSDNEYEYYLVTIKESSNYGEYFDSERIVLKHNQYYSTLVNTEQYHMTAFVNKNTNEEVNSRIENGKYRGIRIDVENTNNIYEEIYTFSNGNYNRTFKIMNDEYKGIAGIK